MNQPNTMEEVSLDGFQVVHSEMFAHIPRKSEATCTIWPTRIAFSTLCLQLLNGCGYIRIEVNPKTKRLLVIPSMSNNKDSIRWVAGTKLDQIRSMESKAFGTEIYRQWNLDPGCNYRTMGRLVCANQKVMLLFDFTEAEIWKNKVNKQQ